MIARPQGHDASTFVVSVSGGKDSTAAILALREADIPARYVFADTGWEVPQTYEHLATLERLLGITIARVEKPGGMVAAAAAARLPTRVQRWCTRELKIEPIRAYHDAVEKEAIEDVVCVVGIRAEESEARKRLPEFEYDDEWGGYVWRPLIAWTIADVLAIHHRHNVPVNPLYRLGFNRVGCMPCVFAAKEDVRLMAEHFPERVALVRSLENHVSMVRRARNHAEPGRYKHENATWFLGRDGNAHTIDDVVAWSQTARGGKQLPLIRDEPDGGCFRWGFCDAAPPETDEEIGR